jgi:4-hydroxy-2-oxoglutarate aldolase
MTVSGSRYEQDAGGSIPPLAPGLYVPTVAFFTPTDEVDLDATALHAMRLVQADVAGLVTHGSNGEAVHLSHEERQLITRTTRTAMDRAAAMAPRTGPGPSPSRMPLLVGCGAQSTRETLQLCREAAQSGATHALVLPPSYYGGLVTTELLVQHFWRVADASPIPVVIYNFPAACGGLDLSSDVLVRLAAHPNVAGAKLTCGNTGKLARVVSETRDARAGPGPGPGAAEPFRAFAGSADFTIQALAVGGHGIIAGLGNLAPRVCVRLLRLWHQGQTDKALELQGLVARADWVAIQGGFVSVKAALQHHHGYGGLPREPCALPGVDALAAQMRGFAEVMELEKTLAAAATATAASGEDVSKHIGRV